MIKQIEMYEITCDKCGKKIKVSVDDFDYAYEKFGWIENQLGADKDVHFCDACASQLKAIINEWAKMKPCCVRLISRDQEYELHNKGLKQMCDTLNDFGVNVTLSDDFKSMLLDITNSYNIDLAGPNGCRITLTKDE